MSFDALLQHYDYLSIHFNYPDVYRNFTSHYISGGDIQLHVLTQTYATTAPTIVFLPGTSIYAMCYAELLHHLFEAGHNIVALDPRGHGLSSGERGDYTITELMQDAEQAIEFATKQYSGKVHLMGSSQGGIVAFYLAAKGISVHSVICQNIADLGSAEALQLARRPKLFRHIRQFMTKYGHVLPNVKIPVHTYINLDAMRVKYFGTARRFMEIDPWVVKAVSLRALRSLAHTPMPVAVEEVKTPVMVIQGSDDSIFPVSYTQQLYNRLRCTKRLRILDGCTHGVLHEKPEVVTQYISEWVKTI